MRNTIMLCALLVLQSLWAVAHAEPNKVLYELQERCSKRAEEVFVRDHEANDIKSGYRNHYNARLNKCLYLETTTISVERRYGKLRGLNAENLFDLNENNNIASFLGWDDQQPTVCRVADQFCHSKREWDALIAPYMTD